MSERFSDLKKVPQEPAARLLAASNAKLKTKLKAPASASVVTVLNELDEQDDDRALIDMLRVLSVCLPMRELVWWSCLAARDLFDGSEEHELPRTLTAAEAWVYKPGDQTRAAAGDAFELAESSDPAKLCAMAVSYHDGTLGVGELSKIQAPAGASQTAAFGVNVKAVTKGGPFSERAQALIDRGIDIARGGDGRKIGKQPEAEGQTA